jgi:hypothetical protein
VGSLGDLEHRAVAVRPAACRCAKEVAVGVGNQAGNGYGTVGSVEADQGGKLRLSDFSCPDLVED